MTPHARLRFNCFSPAPPWAVLLLVLLLLLAHFGWFMSGFTPRAPPLSPSTTSFVGVGKSRLSVVLEEGGVPEHLNRSEFWTSVDVRYGFPFWSLVQKLRLAVQAAGGVPGSELSEQRRVEWEEKNPCIARGKLSLLYDKRVDEQNLWKVFFSAAGWDGVVNHVSANLTPLQIILKEYENLHRTCIQGAGDLTQHFKSRNFSNPCKFTVVEFGQQGIGNRLLWLISAFAYSVLTQRVLLIDTVHTPHKLLCEPFPGSSWLLPSDFPYSSDVVSTWTTSTKFFENMDAIERMLQQGHLSAAEILNLNTNDSESTVSHSVHSNMSSSLASEFHAVKGNVGWNPAPRFFCDNEQTHLNTVRWIAFAEGCLYFLPGLFAIPAFKPLLESIFPDRTPLTPLLRYLIVPVNSVWKRLEKAKGLDTVDKVLGIQVRYRDGGSMYHRYNKKVNANIIRCGETNQLLPPLQEQEDDTRSVGLLVASLHLGTYTFLSRHFNSTTERVKVVKQLSQYGVQISDAVYDEQAMAEIMGLSFSDAIFTTPISTFGYLAQAYAGLRPWLIDESSTSKGCVRGQSVDACYQSPVDRYACSTSHSSDKLFTDAIQYLRRCQDDQFGLQLIRPTSSSSSQ